MKIKFTPACLPSSTNEFDDFQKRAICLSLGKLFSENYFDVCLFDKLIRLLEAKKQKEYNFISIMHCVHYSEMDKEMHEGLIKAVLKYLDIDINVIDIEATVVEEQVTPTSTKADIVREYEEDMVVEQPRIRFAGIRRLIGV